VTNVESLSRDEIRRRIWLVAAEKKMAPNGGSTSAHNHVSTPEPSELHTWESPDWSILDDRRGELPNFPDCLGKTWATVNRAAKGAGVTVAHVAVPLLGIASGLIGVAARVQASTSWLEPATIWCGIVGLSGSGKTPGLEVTKRALSAIAREKHEQIAELRRKHDSKVERRVPQEPPGKRRSRRPQRTAPVRLICRRTRKTPASSSLLSSMSLTEPLNG
jgi:hypothetical protein